MHRYKSMTRMKAIIILLCLSSLSTFSLGQTRRSTRNARDFRISKSHPTVYLTFVRSGKREPEHVDESDQGVWLRLHNNTRWTLSLDAYGAGGKAFARGD